MPFFHSAACACRKFIRGLSLVLCNVRSLIHGRKSFGPHFWKRQQQVAHIALGVDRDHRNVIECGLFQDDRRRGRSCRSRSCR